MSNTFQKILYNLSSIAPVGITFSIVWHMENPENKWASIIFCSSIILILYEISFIEIGKKKFSMIKQSFESVENDDKWVLIYIISYILPFSGLVWGEINWTILSVVGAFIPITMILANFSIPNPVLLLTGYHYYKAKTQNGVQAFTIISRKKDYRNIQQIEDVKRVFEDLLIDGGGKR